MRSPHLLVCLTLLAGCTGQKTFDDGSDAVMGGPQSDRDAGAEGAVSDDTEAVPSDAGLHGSATLPRLALECEVSPVAPPEPISLCEWALFGDVVFMGRVKSVVPVTSPVYVRNGEELLDECPVGTDLIGLTIAAELEVTDVIHGALETGATVRVYLGSWVRQAWEPDALWRDGEMIWTGQGSPPLGPVGATLGIGASYDASGQHLFLRKGMPFTLGAEGEVVIPEIAGECWRLHFPEVMKDGVSVAALQGEVDACSEVERQLAAQRKVEDVDTVDSQTGIQLRRWVNASWCSGSSGNSSESDAEPEPEPPLE